jgi:hypothetical protein
LGKDLVSLLDGC